VSDDPIRILYIGGFGRSGSTLLERTLSRVDGFCAVGEVRHIWDRSFAGNQLCGCGQAFRDCAFWRAVAHAAFGGFDLIDAERMVRLKQQVDRTRYIPSALAQWPARYRECFSEYAFMLGRLYRAIRDVSGCRVIIDSSKEPSYAFVLRALPGVDLSILHLIRDSRAVAFSWLKKKQRPEVHWKHELMARYSPVSSAIHWVTFNTLMHGGRAAAPRYLRLHYEDFARAPETVVRRVLTWIGAGTAALSGVDGHTLAAGIDHTASGNPMRFERGAVTIKSDEEWRTRMAGRDRLLVTLGTLPLLLAYGYLRPRDLLTGRPSTIEANGSPENEAAV
jgi:hypothetical protein